MVCSAGLGFGGVGAGVCLDVFWEVVMLVKVEVRDGEVAYPVWVNPAQVAAIETMSCGDVYVHVVGKSFLLADNDPMPTVIKLLAVM
jgi:hypothetical protein